MSVRRWLVTSLAFLPSLESFFHQIDKPTTRPGARFLGDARLGDKRAAVVENTRHVTVNDAARGGVVRVDVEVRLALGCT